MRLKIEYPQVMKMLFTNQIEVSSHPTLAEIRTAIFTGFWDDWKKMWPGLTERHGGPEHIILKDKEIEIISDTLLQECLKHTQAFQVVFKHS
jgi:hypothetical protein